MHPTRYETIIEGKQYDTDRALLLASDEYWDGHNWERHGRNTFLYRTLHGNFFRLDMTQWEGERDKITVLNKETAMLLYENLPEKIVEYEVAFDIKPEEA